MELAGSPFVTNCDLRRLNRALLIDLNRQQGTYRVNRCVMHLEVRPLFKALKVRSENLKSIQSNRKPVQGGKALGKCFCVF